MHAVHGVSLPVIEAHCDYHRPARYDDELDVQTEGRMLSPVRVEFTYQIVRREDCLGLCPVCGENLNEADPQAHRHEDAGDPRWAKLRDLKLG